MGQARRLLKVGKLTGHRLVDVTGVVVERGRDLGDATSRGHPSKLFRRHVLERPRVFTFLVDLELAQILHTHVLLSSILWVKDVDLI